MDIALVSVIVPSYNHAAFVDAALSSIFSQTHPLLEVIVIDDGSTDETSKTLEPWLRRNVRVLRQKRRGASAARNLGLSHARGAFIAFLDADDEWIRPDMLEAALSHLQTNPETGWTFGDARPFRSDRGQRVFIDAPYLQSGGYYQQRQAGAVTRLLSAHDLCGRDRFFIPTGTLVVRKRCFDEVGCFDEQLKMFEDTDMWLRLLRYPIGFFPDVLLARRVHDSNISHRRHAHLDDFRVLFDRHSLGEHGISFDFHAARAHFSIGRDAIRGRRYDVASTEFRQSLKHRMRLKTAAWWGAAELASRFDIVRRSVARPE